MSEFVQISGLEEIKRQLAAVPQEIATKVLRKGVLAGARITKNEASGAAPQATRPIRRKLGVVTQPGTLRRAAIVKYLAANSNTTQVEYIVTFRKGRRQQHSGRDAFYASWVEFGHGGKVAPPHRFLKPAFDRTYHQALAVELSTMRDELLKLPGFVP